MDTKDKLDDCNKKNKWLQSQLEKCLSNKDDTWDEGNVPDWLDTNQTPYIPVIEIEGETIQLRPQDIYMECRTLREIATPLRKLPIEERFREIWKLVIQRMSYKYDKSDNWLPPIVSWERKAGDCDDSTVLFVTLCRIAHIPADRVFNSCGWYYANGKRYGHSFPIIKLDDGKWYIAESTLNFVPSNFKLLLGSNYDCSWGVANWKFAGKIKPEFNKGKGKVQI